jgi:hypothetical protein
MKKQTITMFENGTLHLLLLVVALALSGCSVTKVNYEKNDKGEVSYRLYRNSHWLKMEGEGMRGGMTQDGNFNFDLEGMKSSPSEEFNRTMQTYTGAFVQLAQIAAAAYNPSASGVAAAKAAEPAQTVVNVQPAAATSTNAKVDGENLSHVEQVETGRDGDDTQAP